MILMRKAEMKTDERYGKRPEERDFFELREMGFVVIDKPPNLTSHKACEVVRKILGAKKSGHVGTLDPKTTGVLPVLLGRATKAADVLLKHNKEYVGVARFHSDVTDSEIRAAFSRFTGEIEQIPPVRAAVARHPRKRTIYFLDLIERRERDVIFRVGCEAGTYVRKLIADIGVESKLGAHMIELRRTALAKWSERDAVTLQELLRATSAWEKGEKTIFAYLKPIELAIDLPRVWVFDGAIEAICSGAQLAAPGVAKVEAPIKIGQTIQILSLKDELIALGDAQMIAEEMITEEKGIAVKIKRVIMPKGTYLRAWKKRSSL